MAAEESLNRGPRGHEVLRQLGVRRPTHDDDQAKPGAEHRGFLIGATADRFVVCDGGPTLRRHSRDPDFVWRIVGEVVGVAFDTQAGLAENGWESST